jgi:hypothetical protein
VPCLDLEDPVIDRSRYPTGLHLKSSKPDVFLSKAGQYGTGVSNCLNLGAEKGSVAAQTLTLTMTL